MMFRALMMSILLAGALTAPAVADDDHGSQADQDACTPDVLRLCESFIPDEGPIVQCLLSKKTELSPACRHVMFSDPTPPAATHHKRHKR